MSELNILTPVDVRELEREWSERQSRPITLDDYFAYAVKCSYTASQDVRDNATTLLTRVNRFLQRFGQFRRVRYGWRPNDLQMGVLNPSRRSKHKLAQAIDIEDPEGDLDQFVMDNQRLLETCGLWAEHPAATKGWCHLQSVPPLSARRIFYP